MKRLAICAALFAGASGALLWSPLAEGQNGRPAARAPREAPPLKIAVIDVGVILGEYKKTEDLREELVSIDKSVGDKTKQLAEQGKELEKKLAKLEQGTPEYLELEQKVQKAASDFNVFRVMQQKDLKHRAAEVQVEVYHDVALAAKKFAEKNDYTLVLQINREIALGRQHRDMNAVLAQPIVRHSPADDITDPILAYLNQQYEAQSQPETPPASTRKSPAR